MILEVLELSEPKHHRHAKLVLRDGTDLEFPYNAGSNLPLMLPAIPSTVGLTFEDCKALSSTTAISTLLSVSDETNQNLSSSQMELFIGIVDLDM